MSADLGPVAQELGLALLQPDVLRVLDRVTPELLASAEFVELRNRLLSAGVGRAVGRADSDEPPRHTETVTMRDAAEQLGVSEEWTRQLGHRGELTVSQPAGPRTAIEVDQISVDRLSLIRDGYAIEEDRSAGARAVPDR